MTQKIYVERKSFSVTPEDPHRGVSKGVWTYEIGDLFWVAHTSSRNIGLITCLYSDWDSELFTATVGG